MSANQKQTFFLVYALIVTGSNQNGIGFFLIQNLYSLTKHTFNQM